MKQCSTARHGAARHGTAAGGSRVDVHFVGLVIGLFTAFRVPARQAGQHQIGCPAGSALETRPRLLLSDALPDAPDQSSHANAWPLLHAHRTHQRYTRNSFSMTGLPEGTLLGAAWLAAAGWAALAAWRHAQGTARSLPQLPAPVASPSRLAPWSIAPSSRKWPSGRLQERSMERQVAVPVWQCREEARRSTRHSTTLDGVPGC